MTIPVTNETNSDTGTEDLLLTRYDSRVISKQFLTLLSPVLKLGIRTPRTISVRTTGGDFSIGIAPRGSRVGGTMGNSSKLPIGLVLNS